MTKSSADTSTSGRLRASLTAANATRLAPVCDSVAGGCVAARATDTATNVAPTANCIKGLERVCVVDHWSFPDSGRTRAAVPESGSWRRRRDSIECKGVFTNTAGDMMHRIRRYGKPGGRLMSSSRIGKFTASVAAFLLMVGFARAASAQVFTGRIDITIEDSTGGRLPGVSVELAGPVNQ